MTLFQKQCLLGYLGYLGPGGPDGVAGPKTGAAWQRFLAALPGQENPEAALIEAVGREKPDFWQEIRHFTREEFRCRCSRCGGFPEEPKEKLVRLADKVREHFGAPATVSSGVRCREHNAEVGGVANSRHLTGRAVDLAVKGVSALEVDAYAAGLPECAYHYPIRSGGVLTGYVHMDVEDEA